MPACSLRFLAVLCALFLVVADGAAAREALTQGDAQGLHRRALSLPGATLRSGPEAGAPIVAGPVPAFTVYYVFGERDGWLEVGPRPTGQPTGWLKADQAEAWKSMLVMEYAPAGRRGRVPFFQDRDALAGLIADPARPARVEALRRDVDAGRPDTALFAAVEPAAVVDRRTRPYLMPILDWTWSEFAGGAETTLVQVGGLNAAALPPPQGTPPAADLGDFRIGMVFVIDTTLSMGPYIDRTYAAVEAIYRDLEQAGALDRVAFGMVGYRDHAEHNPAIGYVTKVYQDLSPDAPPQAILKNLREVRPVDVSTDGWDEDAFAGLSVAINDLNWDPFDARIVVLITDAGARAATDPHAAVPGADERVLADAADRRRISIFPIHLRTAEADRLGTPADAERVYRTLGRTGDSNTDKYLGIASGSVETFGTIISTAVNQIHHSIDNASHGRLAAPSTAPTGQDDMAHLLANEVFRAQLEYIGRTTGTQAPAFYRAWATDRDLADPRLAALRVSVFLNRTQISALAQSLRAIVDRARAADLDPVSFFDSLQGLAATMATDANRAGRDAFADLASSGLLPGFLETLPYHSKVLSLTRDLWLDWGLTGQQEFILELDSKIAIYDALDRDTANWVDLGAGEPGLAVYPLPLEQLP